MKRQVNKIKTGLFSSEEKNAFEIIKNGFIIEINELFQIPTPKKFNY